jgi:hypothetical protein
VIETGRMGRAMDAANVARPILGRGATARVVRGLVAALLVDWLLFPPERRLERSMLPIWLVFPALYLAVTLIRGPSVDWYPYSFLDPRDGGYVSVIAYSLAVLTVFVGVGAFLRWWSNGRQSFVTTVTAVESG